MQQPGSLDGMDRFKPAGVASYWPTGRIVSVGLATPAFLIGLYFVWGFGAYTDHLCGLACPVGL